MKINELPRQEVFRRLVTSENGLTEAEARRRLQEFGPNEITEVRRPRLFRALLQQFTHFLAIILWVAAGLAFLSEYLHPGERMLTLGFAIVAVILINGVFTFIQEYRAEKSIEKLRLLLPFQAKVIRQGKQEELSAREVVPGDLLLLAEGDRVSADARLIETAFLLVNNAPLTGESEPVPLHPEPDTGDLSESKNIVLAGTSVLSGSGRAVVFATGMGTEFGRVAHLTSAVEAGLTPLQKEIAKATRIVAFLATAMGGVFFLAGQLLGRPFWENFLFAIGIIVANVPEGLLPTVTLALAMGSQRMARKKALVKTLTSVETLGSVTVICTDKTGTLTQNRMKVRKLWTQGKLFSPEEANPASAGKILTIASLCNNATASGGTYTGDPTEVALKQAAQGILGEVRSERVFEIPFDSDRKRMTTVNVVDGQTVALTKGAVESRVG
jgi:sodium/potassium-transporting ATPase subunit alpha